VTLPLPSARAGNGVALSREWVADTAHVYCAAENLDALLLAAERPEDLFGMIVAAVRLDLPAVCSPPPDTPLAAAVAGLGLAPVSDGAAEVAIQLGADGGPRPGEFLENFSLANGLRAGVAAGGGPEILVHLAAVAREAGVAGFPQMIRVLAPETPATDRSWTRENGIPALLASLGDDLHDMPTVVGNLKKNLPPDVEAPERYRFVFAKARASGAEAVCRVPTGVPELAGECLVYGSEDEAVDAVRSGEVPDGAVLVVNGCGPRGGPGLIRLDALGEALEDMDVRASVVTDGLPPEDARGTWASLFKPEAALGGVIGRLRDGDAVRFDLEEGRIRATIRGEELGDRESFRAARRTGRGYADRYARSAMPALDGAGFR
jgi:dihydroxy-acid dehydratase